MAECGKGVCGGIHNCSLDEEHEGNCYCPVCKGFRKPTTEKE